MKNKTVRATLPLVKDFKAFWKKQGPFKYALTSSEFPPVLLEPEEWVFSDDIVWLLKDLMQWESRSVSIVEAPFNKNKKNVLKPKELVPWKIVNFPQEWESAVCDTFTPVGYLTESVGRIASECLDSKDIALIDTFNIEVAFFKSLEENIDKIGYLLLKPEPLLGNGEAYTKSYLEEWQADEDAG